MDRSQRRAEAARTLSLNPNLSNAEVARRVGLSPTTVAAVRRTLPTPTYVAKQRRLRLPRRVLKLVRRAISRLLHAGRAAVLRHRRRSPAGSATPLGGGRGTGPSAPARQHPPPASDGILRA
ncbi:winged helix-turn-helix domain-containing protein [Modestobacter sp. VKM Ac-2981]